MLSFISNQQEQAVMRNSHSDGDEELVFSEAIQGDCALITAVNELRELREFGERLNG